LLDYNRKKKLLFRSNKKTRIRKIKYCLKKKKVISGIRTSIKKSKILSRVLKGKCNRIKTPCMYPALHYSEPKYT